MRLGLIHTQSLHEPAVLLRCQAPGFTFLPWPLEAAGLQPLVQQHETITLPVQGFDPTRRLPQNRNSVLVNGSR